MQQTTANSETICRANVPLFPAVFGARVVRRECHGIPQPPVPQLRLPAEKNQPCYRRENPSKSIKDDNNADSLNAVPVRIDLRGERVRREAWVFCSAARNDTNYNRINPLSLCFLVTSSPPRPLPVWPPDCGIKAQTE